MKKPSKIKLPTYLHHAVSIFVPVRHVDESKNKVVSFFDNFQISNDEKNVFTSRHRGSDDLANVVEPLSLCISPSNAMSRQFYVTSGNITSLFHKFDL